MGLEFMESATVYATLDQASVLRRWTQIFSGTGVGVNLTAGRGGKPCLQLSAGSFISKTLTHKTSWTCGWAFKGASGTSIGNADIFQAFNVGTRIAYVRLEADGTFTTRTANNIIKNSTFSIHNNTWYYFEVTFSLSGTTDIQVTMEFKVDGTVVCASDTKASGVNINTLINGLATINRLAYTDGGFGANTYLMDMYMLSNETYWGDIKLGRILPNGDVTTIWSATGSPAYAQVNNVPPDDDVSYIYSSNPGDEENFDWEDIGAFSGAIKGIQYSIVARKDDEGSRSISHTVGNTGSLEFTSDPFFVNDSYVYYHIPLQNDPAGGAWTRANFNAKRFGVKLQS